jgi:murein DD-endopeptidase MepM/ murein hydrolase activator NlpD
LKKIVLIFLTLITLFSGFVPVNADLKDELNLVNRRIKQNQKQFAETKKYQKYLVVKKEVTLDEWQERKGYLDELEIALATTNASINQTKKEIVDARETLSVKGTTVDKKRDEVGKLLTFVHKFSGNRFVEYVLSANSFSELTGRARFGKHILNGTVAAIEKLHDESALVEHTRLKLEQKKLELKDLEVKQKVEQERFTKLADISRQQLIQIESNQKYTQDQLKRIEKSIDDDKAKTTWLLKRIAEEEEKERRRRKLAAYTGKYMWPVNGPLVSPFGMRMHPILRYTKFHEGIDIDARMGTPIVAAGDGLVNYVGWLGGYGNLVIVSHGNGLRTFYGHMSRFGCSVNQEVKKGQIIGYIGSTGLSTGPHLHLEFRQDTIPQNPIKYLPPR